MKKILLLFVCLFVCWVLSAQQRIKVACVGNSITYGTGLSDRATQSYPVKLQKLLGERYEVENFGKPGRYLLKQGHRPYTRQEEYRKALDLQEILLSFIWVSMIPTLAIGLTTVIFCERLFEAD